MFLTETAARADVVFPAASLYEKTGSVTNVCGEVQQLKKGLGLMGPKPDLEIMGLIGRELGFAQVLGQWSTESVSSEIRRRVSALDGRIRVPHRPDLIRSAHNGLFASGTLGRYSKVLNSVLEKSLSR